MWELMRRLISLLEKMPSEETLKDVVKAAASLDKVPSEETLRELISMRSILEKMPTDQTCRELISIYNDLKQRGMLDTAFALAGALKGD